MSRFAPIQIEPAPAPTDEVRALIAALDAELSAEYEPHQRHGLSIDAIFQPHVRFFLARLNGAAVGCGGVALFPDFAEIKRMYVQPEARGRGVAQALLARLEATSRAAGTTLLRLETGTRQPAAIRLYARAGFAACPIFGAYADMDPASIVTSVFLEKQLEEK
jgi:putative acetyltransferase